MFSDDPSTTSRARGVDFVNLMAIWESEANTPTSAGEAALRYIFRIELDTVVDEATFNAIRREIGLKQRLEVAFRLIDARIQAGQADFAPLIMAALLDARTTDTQPESPPAVRQLIVDYGGGKKVTVVRTSADQDHPDIPESTAAREVDF